MRLTTDLFAYCKDERPEVEHGLDLRLPLPREGLLAPSRRSPSRSANGIAYVQAAVDAGLAVDDFAPRLAFFFNGHNNVFQEVAKFRAARRMWAEIMRERFGAQNPKSLMLRFHTQTGGVTLTAQQPVNNIVRVALQGFAAVCGGTQSLHTNGYDEALALPTERAAKIALRTQQIIAHESGAADTVDPFAGSYFVEALTDEIEPRASELIAKIDELGGSVDAIAFITAEIDESAWGYQERYRIEQDIVVGVNKYVEDDARGRGPAARRPRVRARAGRAAEGVQGRPRPGARRQAPRGAARRRPRQRQPAAADPPGAEGQRLDGRGLRRDEGRLRQSTSRTCSAPVAGFRLRAGVTLGTSTFAIGPAGHSSAGRFPPKRPSSRHGGGFDALRPRALPGRPGPRAGPARRRVARRRAVDHERHRHAQIERRAAPAVRAERRRRASGPLHEIHVQQLRHVHGRHRERHPGPLRAGRRRVREPRRALHRRAVRSRQRRGLDVPAPARRSARPSPASRPTTRSSTRCSAAE